MAIVKNVQYSGNIIKYYRLTATPGGDKVIVDETNNDISVIL